MMTEISEAAKAKACELLNTNCSADTGYHPNWRVTAHGAHVTVLAFARFIQEVSDAAKEVEARLHRSDLADFPGTMRDTLKPFILPEPVDPLVDIIRQSGAFGNPDRVAEQINKALAERGLQITQVKS